MEPKQRWGALYPAAGRRDPSAGTAHLHCVGRKASKVHCSEVSRAVRREVRRRVAYLVNQLLRATPWAELATTAGQFAQDAVTLRVQVRHGLGDVAQRLPAHVAAARVREVATGQLLPALEQMTGGSGASDAVEVTAATVCEVPVERMSNASDEQRWVSDAACDDEVSATVERLLHHVCAKVGVTRAARVVGTVEHLAARGNLDRQAQSRRDLRRSAPTTLWVGGAHIRDDSDSPLVCDREERLHPVRKPRVVACAAIAHAPVRRR